MNSKWKTTMMAAIVCSMLAAASSVNSVSAEPAAEATASGEAAAAETTATETTTQAVVESASVSSQTAELANMELAAQNEFLALYYNRETTEIAVKNKRDGSVWYSNPQDREQDDQASAFNKSMLSSQLLLSFSDSSGKPQQFNNFNQSVKYQQYDYEKLNDGIKITYTVGEKVRGVEQIPPLISEERFQTLILDKLQEKDQTELLKRFKHNADKKVYERRDAALNGLALTKALKLLAEAGYDETEMNIDREAYADGQSASQAIFVLPVTYRLDGEQFVVQVSTENIESSGFYLQQLSVLPYFGAAGIGQQGYMFVPDGSGALIRLNNGKLDASPYNEALYGIDSTRINQFKPLGGSATRLPVFGMKKDDAAFVAIIEDGDGIGRVEADVSGRTHSYNYVHSSYEINSFEPLTLSGNWTSNTVPKFQVKSYQGDVTIRYGFLKGQEASYAGMATYYRNYLMDKYSLERLEQKEQTPFFVELIGGVPKKKFFLGVPYTSYQPLTTFSQAQEIMDELKGSGVDNIKLRYTGWFNGGVAHSMPSSVSVDKKLGGQKGFAKLLAYSESNGVELYPDASFMRVNQKSGGFKPKKDASRTIIGTIASIYPYDRAGYYKDTYSNDPAFALSPSKLPGVVDKFTGKYNKLKASALSLRDLGSELNSDFNTKHVITREETKRTVQEQLASLKESSKLMVSGGNAYSLPYVDSIVDAPLSDSGYNIADGGVPFYEMALHGLIDYAGSAINMSDDQTMRYHVLKSLETGSNLYFTWFYAKSSSVKETSFDYFYSAHYKDWISEATAAYNEVNTALQQARTQFIVGHEELEKGVYQTTYEDGTTVVVNYNDYAVKVKSEAVESMGYRIGGERN
ncbi:DUF5696 domain-containing protein [Paenibacillus radicis (ex Gao et al. 2016)]|uniref:Uncharacterized protein n=1 Tax=Paenibacillus radicis (ex Gao et al. 2016) TaxID=1737354 RepID=A0A917GQB8_9BACL|nr:DUF5696 domain-containing protein [Paenibacillus radicis (ex Gao et al. 2016)]GGG53461.1 hypothetical protein GCM10010918_02670 [Paenibacillus radicis (ex Gao et al. 2016)]